MVYWNTETEVFQLSFTMKYENTKHNKQKLFSLCWDGGKLYWFRYIQNSSDKFMVLGGQWGGIIK